MGRNRIEPLSPSILRSSVQVPSVLKLKLFQMRKSKVNDEKFYLIYYFIFFIFFAEMFSFSDVFYFVEFHNNLHSLLHILINLFHR
jgi:hypothetical protein